jgi:hypothetical protein
MCCFKLLVSASEVTERAVCLLEAHVPQMGSFVISDSVVGFSSPKIGWVSECEHISVTPLNYSLPHPTNLQQEKKRYVNKISLINNNVTITGHS